MINFKLYREYGALNSKPIFDAFAQGVRSLGHNIVDANEDVAVIWSVLWAGRMANNKNIYQKFIAANKPIIIIEVGNLKRNITWRISLDNINNLGFFGNNDNLDSDRPRKLGVSLKDINTQRRSEILIATQHQQSLQWQGQPSMSEWVINTVSEIRKYSGRKIIVRPHPRSRFSLVSSNFSIEVPQKIPGSYDDYDIDYNYHCVINHNSGPAVQAAINGTPIICDSSSLASKISGKFQEIENIQLPDRTQWFLELCHTEWTIDEIRQGIPLSRLTPKIFEKIR